MLPSTAMSNNSTSISEELSLSSEARAHEFNSFGHLFIPTSPHSHHYPPQPNFKKKRSQPGNPDPGSEVIALSPKTLMATNRFVCEICNKGFQRDQNLQLHKRGHNLPWKLQKLQKSNSKDQVVRKRVYVCPEASCVHHHPSRALGDITGIKKHFCRKHGEKKWKCERCSKKYAVCSDWKAHVKTCGTREYRCDCGTIFSRKDSFITHRAFCDALAEECARLSSATANSTLFLPFSPWDPLANPIPNLNPNPHPYPHPIPNLNPNPHPYSNPFPNPYPFHAKHEEPLSPLLHACLRPTITSATTSTNPLLTIVGSSGGCGEVGSASFDFGDISTYPRTDQLTRDFLGVAVGEEELLSLTYGRGHDLIKPLAAFPVAKTWGDF